MPYCAYCASPVDIVSYAPCSACGNPRNGAPRAGVKGGGANSAVIVVVVVAAVLVFVAIAGILAAIAIPNLLTAMQRSRQKRTMADIRAVATAVEAYAAEREHYPAADALQQALVPKYIAALPLNDGWANPLRYQCWNNNNASGPCNAYAIASGGKDRSFEREDLKAYAGVEASTNLNDDIVFSNGQFIKFPAGTQR
jgi:general secretion pathway protein G